MITNVSFRAEEGSTLIVRADFVVRSSDISIADVPVTPNAGLKWSLYDAEGEVVNSKEDQPLIPAETVYIVLSGDDLALVGDYSSERRIIITGTFDSIYGNDLPIRSETRFQIENLVNP